MGIGRQAEQGLHLAGRAQPVELAHQVAVALAQAGGVDQHQLVVAQAFQHQRQALCAVGLVHGDAQLAAVAVQLLAATDAHGVGGHQGHIARVVALGEAGRQLGDGGGLAGPRGADQGDHAAGFQRIGLGDGQLLRQQSQHQAATAMGLGVGGNLQGDVAGDAGVEAVVFHQLHRLHAHRRAAQAFVGEAVHLALDHFAHRRQFAAHLHQLRVALARVGGVVGHHGQRGHGDGGRGGDGVRGGQARSGQGGDLRRRRRVRQRDRRRDRGQQCVQVQGVVDVRAHGGARTRRCGGFGVRCDGRCRFVGGRCGQAGRQLGGEGCGFDQLRGDVAQGLAGREARRRFVGGGNRRCDHRRHRHARRGDGGLGTRRSRHDRCRRALATREVISGGLGG